MPVLDRQGLRPTPERIRETVFDWLMHLTGGFEQLRFCDLFAGTGALGMEAASRGAQSVRLIEKDRRTAAGIAALADKLGAGDRVSVLCADAFAYMQSSAELYDVVFIDPPFALKWQLQAAQEAVKMLSEQGILYIEHEEEIAEEHLAEIGLCSIRRGRAGAVYFLLAVRLNNATEDAS